VSFIEGGLSDLSVSRTSFTWGIPVPDDPAHVMYVWFDALTNYLTALGFGSSAVGAGDRIARYWPSVIHLIGKEIVRQHAIYWPAFLMSAGLTVPRRIVAHGFWMMGGAKMSKSLGNVARYQDYVDVFGVDGLRYFVMREMPLGQDSNFADEAMLTRFNSDLANDLGNVISRTMTMIQRYCGGRVPESPPAGRQALDTALEQAIDRTIVRVKREFDAFQISIALQETWDLIRQVNKYIVEREPWTLAKDAASRPTLDATLYHSADALRVIAALTEPVMPGASVRIRTMLGTEAEAWSDLRSGTLRAGTQLGAVEPLFPRIERTVEELRGMTTSNEPTPVAPQGGGGAEEPNTAAGTQVSSAAPAPAEDARLSIDDFMKVELRVAKVLAAEAVPKSKKLIKLRVDAGSEERTVVAGIAEAYAAEQLVGRTIVIVANLKPAKLMGIESNGMVLAASPEGGKPTLVAVDESLPAGTRVR
jgi:methionyl-tRNA synthetase